MLPDKCKRISVTDKCGFIEFHLISLHCESVRECDIGAIGGAKIVWTVVAASLQRRVLAWGSLFRVILV